MNTEQLCITLAGLQLNSGRETKDSEYLCSLLGEYMPAKIDALGNIVGKTEERGKCILLDAHSDCVGLVATAIDSNGFIKFDRYGGADLRVLTGCEVTVLGKKELYGVISSIPPHLIKDKSKSREINIEALAIDTGLCYEDVTSLVSPGDRIEYRKKYYKLNDNIICGPAFDNRCSVAAILLCLERLKQKGIKANIAVQFTVQEERGKAGAKTAAFASNADECIALDVGFACQPGIKAEESIVMGKGVSVGYSPILDKDMSNKLLSLAKNKNIPVQCDATGGLTHTNADEISVQKEGIKCALLSIPLSSMHTYCEAIDLTDVEAAADLIYEYIIGECEMNGNA